MNATRPTLDRKRGFRTANIAAASTSPHMFLTRQKRRL
jgi:hypothetical protein